MSEPGAGSLPTWEDLVKAITGADPADLAVTHLPDGVSGIDGLRARRTRLAWVSGAVEWGRLVLVGKNWPGAAGRV